MKGIVCTAAGRQRRQAVDRLAGVGRRKHDAWARRARSDDAALGCCGDVLYNLTGYHRWKGKNLDIEQDRIRGCDKSKIVLDGYGGNYCASRRHCRKLNNARAERATKCTFGAALGSMELTSPGGGVSQHR